jgi:ABC-type antimicrobial peptide transport system permease subunit
MFKNYFKIAWRNLFRNKGFSITNILGLTIGITCTILIFLWVQDERTYDKFQKNYDNIYQVMANRDFKNNIFTDPNMVLPLASSLEKAYPQIKNAVVTTQDEQDIFSYQDSKLKKTGLTVGGDFFDMFSWKFIKGNAATAFRDPSSIVLTESSAKTFFGNTDPINKVLKMNNETNMKVTGVVADPPGNSSIQFDFIKPFNYSDPDVKRSMSEWTNSSWRVYLQTVPGTNIAFLDKNINALKKQHDTHDKVSTYFSFPMSKWRLYSDFKDGKNVGGMIEYVKLFTIIAIIILLIACVNFMNLSTARSEKRAKEVGVRKTLGSNKKQLILQFFFESMIIAFIAFIFSAIAVYLLLPSFNSLVNKHLTLNLTQPYIWIGGLVIIVFTGVVAGSYPALYLSSFNPIKVLKGTFLAGRKAVLPRRILVVAQFVISILLISATIIIYQQIQHVKNRDIGYNADNLIMLDSSPDVQKNYAIIKNELLKTGMVSAVTRTFSPITDIWWKSPAPHWDGEPADANIIVTGFSTGRDFTKTMGVKMFQGKDFSGLPSDSSAIMLNKAAVDVMGLKNPIGMLMRYGRETYTVTGVTANVVMGSPYKPVEPMMIFYQPDNTNVVSVRLNQSANLQKALKSIESIFKTYNPSVPFDYRFADKEFGKKFITEELISKLTNIFSGLAIFICCIGLAGLASFTIEKRIREIGIRKVLGSSIQQILFLISKEFLKLVFIAFVIAVPLTWWAMNSWLQKYEYRIHISIWLFAAVGFLILLLTLTVVSLNTLRAARANPVKSLRTE